MPDERVPTHRLSRIPGWERSKVISNFRRSNCSRGRGYAHNYAHMYIYTWLCNAKYEMAETKYKVPNGALNGQVGHGSTTSKPERRAKESFPDPPLMKAVLTHLGYGIMIIFGHILDFLRKLGLISDPYSKALKNEVFNIHNSELTQPTANFYWRSCRVIF